MRIGQRRVSLEILTEGGERMLINEPGADVGNTQLEVDIGVSMSVSPTANSATVRILNLSRDNRQAIAGRIKRNLDISAAIVEANVDYTSIIENSIVQQTVTRRGDAYVRISAGYDSHIPEIFEGSCQYARHYKNGATWATELQVGDGLSTMSAAVADRSFPPGSLFIDVLRHVVRTMALDDSVLRTPLQLTDAIGRGNATFPYGYTAFGDSRWIVSNMLEPFGAEWFVDRGQFFVVRKGHTLPEPAAFLTPESGLMTHPEPTEDGSIRVRSMFRPDIRIGRKVRVSGVDFDGDYRVETVQHRMNNRYGQAVTEAFLSVPEVA